jgi:hypothetical protein
MLKLYSIVRTIAGLAVLLLCVTLPLCGGSLLVSEAPWGSDTDTSIMDNVFGPGNYTFVNSYASANPSSIFNATNSFVWLEGGDGTETDWGNYVNTNEPQILSWVGNGGALLIMSAGWYGSTVNFGPGGLISVANYSACGTLTAAGATALPGTATSQCGNDLGHDLVTGTGLTDFMDGASGSLLSGTKYGAGYIMFSGLTDVEFHDNGPSLLNDVVAYTAGQANTTPEPASVALIGLGLVGLAMVRRRKRS